MKLKSVNGEATLQVSAATFDSKFNEALVHQVLTATRESLLAGTVAPKSRAGVGGGGR